MKIVIAPDSFKESLTATQVAEAIAQGVIDAIPSASVDLCPMADGGEGTVDAMVTATNGTFEHADVFSPLGQEIRARFGLLGIPDGAGLPGQVGLSAAMTHHEGEGAPMDRNGAKTAVIEMAAASGLGLVPQDKRDPRRTTTFGTGQLILAALDVGAREIILGIGGSATTDGGAGCAQALGVTFLDENGEACSCGLAGGGLHEVQKIDMSDRDQRIDETNIRVACDVTNPLVGENGAARVYGPQKGATDETVEQLDDALNHFADVIRRDLNKDVKELPGAGAAGGLGAGLVAFTDANLEPGLPMIAHAVKLEQRIADADLCITGEGKFDAQSAQGKTACGVAQIARKCDVPVICIPGQAADDAPVDAFDGVFPLVAGEVTVKIALQKSEELLRKRAAEALRRGPRA